MMLPMPHSISSASGHAQYHHHMLQFPALPTLMESSSSWKPNIEVAPNCPRCASSNTKFCYFNNYSLSQPRYFCKSCRRYWTKGGSLRNIPVGGGSRKTRLPKSGRRPQGQAAPLSNSITHISGTQVGEANGCESEIDMALVFAKFLNQNPNSHHDGNGPSSSSNFPNSLTSPESIVEAQNDESGQPPSDLIRDCDHVHGLLGGLPQEEETIQKFVEQELYGIELEEEDLLRGGGDEVVPDVFRSDATTTSSFIWPPPMMPLQQRELEFTMAMPLDEDAQFPIMSTMNSTGDGWSWSSLI